MSLGIIIYTGKNFDIDTKLPFLKSCVNSVKRQKSGNAELIVLCEAGTEQKGIIERETGTSVCEFNNLADGINNAIRELECDKFIISKYNTLYSANSLSDFSKYNDGESLVFNITCNEKGSSRFVPVFSKVNAENEFTVCPSVWNVLFDKKTIINNSLGFTDFSYRDQYIFLMNHLVYAKKVVYSDNVYLCIDRALNIKIKPSDAFYKNNKKAIFRIIKLLKRNRKGVLLSCFIKDFGVPLLRLSCTEKNRKKRWFYRLYARKIMNSASGILR